MNDKVQPAPLREAPDSRSHRSGLIADHSDESEKTCTDDSSLNKAIRVFENEKGEPPHEKDSPYLGWKAETPSDEEKAAPKEAEDDFPDGGLRAWLVVLASWSMLFPAFGFMNSIGTLQAYWQQHHLSQYPVRDVGWISSVMVFLSLALGVCAGPLFDIYGPRWIALSGSIGFILMMFLLAECEKYWHFVLCAALGGASGAHLMSMSLAMVAQWFKKRRALAQGVAMTGSSFGGVAVPLILRTTLRDYGYAWSLRILGFIFLGLFILGNVLVKARMQAPKPRKKHTLITLRIFGDLRFLFLTISVFGFEIVLFGALGILPTYTTMSSSYSRDAGFYIIAILNGTSCFGRIIPGYIADKVGRFNTLLFMLVITLIFMLILWLPFGEKSPTALYCFAALFGFGTGSWMALTPACLGQLCKAEEFGRYYGSMYFVASFATLICVPIGGQLLEMVGPKLLVGFYSGMLGLSLISFAFSRWACLDRRWVLKDKV